MDLLSFASHFWAQLTKLNFNTRIFGDGFPVTLRFADDVGEILTAIPEVSSKPLPFRHYI